MMIRRQSCSYLNDEGKARNRGLWFSPFHIEWGRGDHKIYFLENTKAASSIYALVYRLRRALGMQV